LFIVTLADALEPEYDPVPLPDHEMKRYWQPVPHETVVGDTLNEAVAPVLYQPLPEVEPYDEMTVRYCCVPQLAVSVIGPFIVMVVEEELPL
jgi:hypothetical protein